MFRSTLIGAFAVLVLGITSLGVGSKTVSAEVVKNEWWPAAVNRDNPCELGTVEIKLSGLQHQLWYTTPQGTLKMNLQAHLTGVDTDGTEYVANMQRHMEHQLPFPPGVPFTDTFTTNLISKGSTVNAQIVMVFDFPSGTPPVATFTACRG